MELIILSIAVFLCLLVAAAIEVLADFLVGQHRVTADLAIIRPVSLAKTAPPVEFRRAA